MAGACSGEQTRIKFGPMQLESKNVTTIPTASNRIEKVGSVG
jgi:hypothetical protein